MWLCRDKGWTAARKAVAMMGQGDPRWLRRVVKLDEPLDRRECYVVSIKLRSMENYALTCGRL